MTLLKQALISLALIFSPLLKADVLTLTSLEWPPYSSPQLKQKGASIAVVSAALKEMGHELKVEFYPWERAVHLAKNDARYAGYFPEYLFESSDLLFSDSIGLGPLGFAENKAKPVQWSALADLKSYTIGVVRGYVNTDELDQMIADGTLKSEAVNSDSQNLTKLGHKRIPLAVIDSNVFQYLIDNTPSLQPFKADLQMNPKLLVEKSLHVAFTNNQDGQRWQEILNQGLKRIDVDKIMADYLAN
ncbi:transporter substrate-binding domain-containing protein [Vibrio navarrensis]|nr:transporter substrate-binding domain-containing protein [Vibrio navarrensis]EJL6398169.1 transporter substrate-binding domain-containing protein [Vibrio navarrensis]EJL6568313.1 transporter substrate-binding domain-containing protein [Vibrio navarrensis]